MDDKTLDMIQALADKLEVTAGQLWTVLVAQAPISGAATLFALFVSLLALVWLFTLARRKHAEYKASETGDGCWDEDALYFAWAIFVIGSIMCIIAAVANLHSVVAAFFNPEYWALKHLLRLGGC